MKPFGLDLVVIGLVLFAYMAPGVSKHEDVGAGWAAVGAIVGILSFGIGCVFLAVSPGPER